MFMSGDSGIKGISIYEIDQVALETSIFSTRGVKRHPCKGTNPLIAKNDDLPTSPEIVFG